MNFGSDEFYLYIKQYIADPSRDDLYVEIAKVVEKDTKELLYKKGFLHSINSDDIADITQEIQLSVRRSMVSFLKNSEGKSPSQRNAWLATIVNRRINDYFRVYYSRLNKHSLYSEIESLASTEDSIAVLDCSNSSEDFDLILRLLNYICDINTSPEKIIAFLYNKILITLCCGERLNGFPEQIAAELKDQTLARSAGIMKEKLGLLLGKEIPESVFEGLNEKLDDIIDGKTIGEHPFKMSPRVITDSSHWISKKIKKNKDNILWGEKDGPSSYNI